MTIKTKSGIIRIAQLDKNTKKGEKYMNNQLDFKTIKNHLPHINLTSKQIEKQANKLNVSFLKNNSNKIENGIHLPSFVNFFLRLVKHRKRLPTQKEFAQYYIHYLDVSVKNKIKNKDELMALKARLYRVYPSIVRELHIIKKISEEPYWDQVIYNEKIDLKYGYDLLIAFSGIKFGLKIFINTKRSNYYLNKKKNRSKDTSGIVTINIPFNFPKKSVPGKLYLYSNEDFKNFLVQIMLEQSKVIKIQGGI